MKRSITIAFFLVVFLTSERLSVAGSREFQAALEASRKNNQTKTGNDYVLKCSEAILQQIGPAMGACLENTPDTKEPAILVFIIAADGRVTRVMASPNIPYGQCVLAKVDTNHLKVPPPPHDGWPFAVGLANHHHEEMLRKSAPKDNPVEMRSMGALGKYDKAIAPYVAKARATYPAAKKRFLAGLPSGQKFLVRARLIDGPHVEDSFIDVESIKNGKITGTLGRVDIVTNYKQGQQITIPESQIDNWLILHSDGTEGGNYVGKFLDTYKH